MRKSIAIVLGIILALQTPVSLYESEHLNNESERSGIINTESSSYVVLMEEGTELVQTMSAQGETNMMAVTEAAAEDLKDQNIAVLELTEEEVKELERRSDVIAVEEDIILTANGSGLEGVREYKRERAIDRREDQWNLDAVHLPQAIENTDIVRTAVLDSGVSYSSDLDIKENISINDVGNTVNVIFDDATGHGTGIAGIIGAKDNEKGIRGIHPEAEIYSIRILDENNQATLSQAVAGIYQAIESGCNILNMSFGTSVNSEILHEAIRAAYDAGMLLIAAAGNQEGEPVEYPAAYEEVMAVGATDTTGNKRSDTSDGTEIEIFAPGTQVPTSGLFGGTLIVEGTSIAAAQVSGAASLLWAKDKTKSAGFIRSLLKNTAQTIENPGISGAGLLDIENAFNKYDSLEQVYMESVCEYESIQAENRNSEEYENITLVNGLWGRDQHENMAVSATDGYSISSNNIQLMSTAARKADDKPYDAASKLHASDNYIRTMKFLYLCASYLRSGKLPDEAVSLASAGVQYNSTDAPELIQQTLAMIKTDLVSGINEANPTARYFKVLGFAMHLAGDTFAHRTIVPKYTVAGTNPTNPINSTSITSVNARFGTTHFLAQGNHTMENDQLLKDWAKHSASNSGSICKRWKCFQRTVNLGVMEFKDVKNFSSANKPPYEDVKDFCKERFSDAGMACDVLFIDSYGNEAYDGLDIFIPVENYVVLNNLKGYMEAIGEDTSSLTASEWSKISTPDLY